jgi:methionyl aminopeptidase
MSIESQADLDGLRRAGDVTRLTLDALEAHVRAGITTADLDAVAAGIFASHGAVPRQPSSTAFPVTCSSASMTKSSTVCRGRDN